MADAPVTECARPRAQRGRKVSGGGETRTQSAIRELLRPRTGALRPTVTDPLPYGAPSTRADPAATVSRDEFPGDGRGWVYRLTCVRGAAPRGPLRVDLR